VSPEQIRDVLDKHAKWLRGEDGGERANLAGADLAGANLAGADLAGANLADANLADANLAGANLAGAYLAGADLAGANLADANLADANLADAYLAGAKIAAGEVARHLSGGWLLAYGWTALVMRDGATRLRYGCEEHALTEWPALLHGLCEKHVASERVDEYERDLTALLAFVGALGVRS